MTREEAIKQLRLLKGDITFGIASKVENKNQIEALSIAIASLETDEAYQLEYESTTKNDLSSGTRKNSQKLENVSPVIDWNNCHTSEQLDSISTAQNDLGVDFKLKDYVSREAVRRIIKSPRTQEQMLNALNSLRNATECKAEDCINRDYTAKYVEEFANNEYVSQDEAETIYLIADGIRHIPSALPDVHDNNVGNIDCISREQALKELKESAEHHANDCREEVLLRRDRDIIRALPSVTPQEPRWIPTSERLPEERLGVLVWCPTRKNIYCACYEEKQWWIFGAYWEKVTEEIVAWRSLPTKPYSEVEK